MFLSFSTANWKITTSDLFGDTSEQKRPTVTTQTPGFCDKCLPFDSGAIQYRGREAPEFNRSVNYLPT